MTGLRLPPPSRVSMPSNMDPAEDPGLQEIHRLKVVIDAVRQDGRNGRQLVPVSIVAPAAAA